MDQAKKEQENTMEPKKAKELENVYNCLTIGHPAVNHITVPVPGSKSMTNRALLLAAMSQGTCVITGALFSDDSRYFMQCLEDLGFETQVSQEREEIRIHGMGGKIPREEGEIYVGSAGTAARFLTAFLGLSSGRYRIQASEQMKRRPMKALFDSLEQLGAQVLCEEEPGHLPITILGRDYNGRSGQRVPSGELRVLVDIEQSSQFLSALLICGCRKDLQLQIQIQGTHGMSYIDMTLGMIRQFGGSVQEQDGGYLIDHQQLRAPEIYRVEPDLSAACYFYSIALLLGIEVTVPHVQIDSLQGDREFLHLLERLGCSRREKEPKLEEVEGLTLTGPRPGKDGRIHFPGISADLGSYSDQTMTLSALAPFADSPTEIHGISHIRYQESNRLEGILQELHRMGISAQELEGGQGLRIVPGQPKPSRIQTYEDHRMAMAFSLVGLRAKGMQIMHPDCCRKTFANYFTVFHEISCQLSGRCDRI